MISPLKTLKAWLNSFLITFPKKPVVEPMQRLEGQVRFSASKLWQHPKKYYVKKGIAAWVEDVPLYPTSNPVIGRDYAKMIWSFIQDWVSKNKNSQDSIFYIVELGAGSGRFSFLCLQNLLDLQNTFQMHSIRLCYVMSDANENLKTFWKERPQLKPFLNAGVLSFATFDPCQSDMIRLDSGEAISSDRIQNPVIFIANYFFDSLPTDIFHLKNGKMYETLVTTKCNTDALSTGGVLQQNNIHIHYTDILIENKYYHNEFDALLFSYLKNKSEGYFQFPITPLRMLQNLQHLSNNQFLLLSTDKGYAQPQALISPAHPHLAFHGTFSVTVNYHAIADYLKKDGGESALQEHCPSILTGIFSSGFSWENLPQLKTIVEDQMVTYSTADAVEIYAASQKNRETMSLNTLIAQLRLSNWDPNVFYFFRNRLLALISQSPPALLSYLIKNIYRIAQHYYPLEGDDRDVYFYLGLFCQRAESFEMAITYYQKSMTTVGDDATTALNIAICYYQRRLFEEALSYCQKALLLKPQWDLALSWIEKIKKYPPSNQLNHIHNILP